MQKENWNGALTGLLVAALALSTVLNVYLYQQQNRIRFQYESERGFTEAHRVVYTETQVLQMRTMLNQCQLEQDRKDSLIRQLQSRRYRTARYR